MPGSLCGRWTTICRGPAHEPRDPVRADAAALPVPAGQPLAAAAVMDTLFWLVVVVILVAFVATVAIIVLDPRARP